MSRLYRWASEAAVVAQSMIVCVPVDAKPVDRCRHVAGVPRDHRVGQQVRARRLVHLLLLLLRPDPAPVGEEPELLQRVQRLPLVELGVDAAPELRALQIPQDEDRLDQAAIFQQGAGQGVLAAVRLEQPEARLTGRFRFKETDDENSKEIEDETVLMPHMA
jgi:hypothetical protein